MAESAELVSPNINKASGFSCTNNSYDFAIIFPIVSPKLLPTVSK